LALELEEALVMEFDFATGELLIAGSNIELQRRMPRRFGTLDHIHPDDRARCAALVDNAMATGSRYRVEYRLNPEGDEETWVSSIGEVIHDQYGRPERILAVMKDITQVRQRSLMVERLAFSDALTGLSNRALFQREFTAAAEATEQTGEALGLIMIDVDHFKDINDTLGHDAGDALLCALAEKLSRSFRQTDLVCRLGGDEFAIILKGLHTVEDLVRPVKVLQQMLLEPIQHKGQGFTISTSIGAALHDDPDADATHLIKNADIALYRAKCGGRNRVVVFEPSMRSEVEKRLELLRDVRAAIPLGEFTLFYQPVVSLDAGAVVGLEALMRWNHPDQGVLAPGAFLDAFEDQDLALQLGEVTINTALRQMRKWMDDGVEFGRVAINISAAQFRTGKLAADIGTKLKRWNVPPEKLTIEVTENVYMGWGAEIVGETVRALHDTGVSIALDDFGTGYASLANLRQFPIDRLKIDKSFVQNIEDEAIVRAVINLGASLGMEVVAEGVEKLEQLDTVSKYGCDKIQGFHFARPMPPGEIPAFMAEFAGGRVALTNAA